LIQLKLKTADGLMGFSNGQETKYQLCSPMFEYTATVNQTQVLHQVNHSDYIQTTALEKKNP
jgi:hypothetical protein